MARASIFAAVAWLLLLPSPAAAEFLRIQITIFGMD
jgi:hypothetical protein